MMENVFFKNLIAINGDLFLYYALLSHLNIASKMVGIYESAIQLKQVTVIVAEILLSLLLLLLYCFELLGRLWRVKPLKAKLQECHSHRCWWTWLRLLFKYA